MKKLIIFLMILITGIATANNIYIDENLGFSFEYPKEIELRRSDFFEIEIEKRNTYYNKKYVVGVVTIKDIDLEVLRDPGYTEEYFLELLNNKEESLFFARKDKYSHRYFKQKGKIIGEESFDLLYVPSSFYRYSLYFFKNNYCIIINIAYYDVDHEILKKYPQYFMPKKDSWDDDKGTHEWKSEEIRKKVWDMIVNDDENGPIEFRNVYKYFQIVRNSLKLF